MNNPQRRLLTWYQFADILVVPVWNWTGQLGKLGKNGANMNAITRKSNELDAINEARELSKTAADVVNVIESPDPQHPDSRFVIEVGENEFLRSWERHCAKFRNGHRLEIYTG